MSLVAYTASSDEDSDYTDSEDTPTSSNRSALITNKINQSVSCGKIGDNNEGPGKSQFTRPAISSEKKKPDIKLTFGLSLPKPKNDSTLKTRAYNLKAAIPAFSNLPLPKYTQTKNAIIEEEDDEFLHKRAMPCTDEVKPKPSLLAPVKNHVKITIPSLKEFSDVDQELAAKTKNKPLFTSGQTKATLLSLLPQAKSERIFTKSAATNCHYVKRASSPQTTRTNTFIPDTVKNRRPAYNTEGVDGIHRVPTKHIVSQEKPKTQLVDCSDSEGSDEDGDFFSLNSVDKLPEVSTNEINAMVAKSAAKIAKTAIEFYNTATEKKINEDETTKIKNEVMLKNQHEGSLDQVVLHALAGSNAKRRRREQDIQVVDISSDEVLPSREEWMRTALASSTSYQPTGVLVDEEPAAGTRRKHQITYLAHKAKSNEAELQAIWAANRQTRRATQSKYGF